MEAVKKPYHHGDLESALVAAALETIRDKGVDALTLRGVGAMTGVSRTALYRHFSDKAALLARVSLEGFRALRAALQAAESLEDMGEAYVAYAVENPSHYRTMFGRAIDDWNRYPALLEEAESAFGVLLQAVKAEQHGEHLRPADSHRLAEVIWSTVHGVAMLSIDGQLHHRPGGAGGQVLGRFATECLCAGIWQMF